MILKSVIVMKGTSIHINTSTSSYLGDVGCHKSRI
jgi:hypothetical protein